ncbi:uncharacterized protein L199_006935 [Kwoniella botswanensis]|uniref:uncharacterized protein n=1 Tax=Kwoniella botswanensis TaxID=1268659 RepID=UPI00315CC447
MPMPGLSEEHDTLLLGSSWLGKKDQHGKTHLFKYCTTPDKQSFILLTTNLETIYFHSPAPEDIPAVPWEVDHPFLLSTQDLIREQFSDEPIEQVEGLVERIKLMVEERWDEVQLLIEVEDGVKVAYMRMEDFAWRFVLNELTSSQSIPFLTRHLLQPLTGIIATDRSIPLPTSLAPSESSSRLISDPEIMRAIRRNTTKPKVQPQTKTRSSSQIPSSDTNTDNEIVTEGSPTPRKPSRRTKATEEPTPIPSSSSSMPPSSPPKIPHNESSSRQPTSSIPPSSSPPPGLPSSERSETTNTKSKSKMIDQSSSPSAGSAMDFRPPTQTQTQTQKTKREREKEEEEIFEKRKKDLQKKMDKGGIGKLGKRRLAR